MTEQAESQSPTSWWAKGLLFENCSCQLVCPGHIHFDQLCTHDRCLGYWAIRFDDGHFEDTCLEGVNVVIAYDTPQHMIDGDWIQTIIIDESADEAQRRAVEQILTGTAGGPWAKLHPFVGRLLPTRYEPIVIKDEPTSKRVFIRGLLEGVVKHIRGRERDSAVTFENAFNQIHNSTQIICRGDTRYDDGTIVVGNSGTHGLYSRFHWKAAG